MILLPELECLLAFLEISSATNEVAMLNNGMLKILDRMLKIATPIPADASSMAPSKYMPRLSQEITNSFAFMQHRCLQGTFRGQPDAELLVVTCLRLPIRGNVNLHVVVFYKIAHANK
jgi:hypothetical protein